MYALPILYAHALWLIQVQLNQNGTRVLHYQWLRQLGSISYTVYLFQPIVLASTFLLAGRPERISSTQDAVLAAGALCATLLWVAISQKLI